MEDIYNEVLYINENIMAGQRLVAVIENPVREMALAIASANAAAFSEVTCCQKTTKILILHRLGD